MIVNYETSQSTKIIIEFFSEDCYFFELRQFMKLNTEIDFWNVAAKFKTKSSYMLA